MTDSEGAQEKQIWGKRANWVDYSAQSRARSGAISIIRRIEAPHLLARAATAFAVNLWRARLLQ
jgi:hypothetical protein